MFKTITKQAIFFSSFVLFLTMFYSEKNYAQNIGDTLVILQYDSLGKLHFQKNELDSCIFYNQQLLNIFTKKEDWENVIKNVNMIAYCHYAKEDIDKMGECLLSQEKVIDKILALKGSYSSLLMKYWNLLATYYFKTGNLSQKINYNKKALGVLENKAQPDSIKLAVLYQNLAIDYQALKDHKTALDYSLKGLYIYRPRGDRKETELDSLAFINTIATQYAELKDIEKANYYFKEALRFLRKNSAFGSIQKIELTAFLNLKKYFPESELDLLISEYLNPFQKSIFLKRTSDYYLTRGDTTEALQLLNQSLKLCKDSLGLKSRGTSSLYLALGDFYKIKKPDQALSYYQRALTSIVWDFNDSIDVSKNPTINQVTYSKIDLFEILKAKAETLKQLGRFDIALKTYERSIETMEDIRQNYIAESSKLMLQEKGLELFEDAIEVAIQLGENEKALVFSEQSKVALLQEVVQDSKAKMFASIPEVFLEKEKQLKEERGVLERQLYAAQEKNDTSEVLQLNNELFTLSRTYTIFKENLLNDFPEYHNLKYQEEQVSLIKLQEKLKENQSIIEYFYGEKQMYTFVIRNDRLEVLAVPTDGKLMQDIKSFRNLVREISTDITYYKSFTNTLYGLYTKLLEPTLPFLDGVEEITIIPDGAISYIPFQALIKYPVAGTIKKNRYDTLHYLVNDYCFDYVYSSTLSTTFEELKVDHHRSNFGGFAPVFDASRSNEKLEELKYSLKEVTIIDSILGGQSYLKEAATRSNFKKDINQHKIIHLSTHTSIDDQNPMNSEIHFIDSSLTISEIYGLPIQARLTVLSACETGVGELKRGEGIMSLARAFTYAGCPSIFTSLWSVSDEETAGLMINFYENLHQGKEQHRALHTAQQNYLSNIQFSEKAHPFYWSGFIHIGQQDALFNNISSNNWYWIGFIGILLLVGLSFWKKKAALN